MVLACLVLFLDKVVDVPVAVHVGTLKTVEYPQLQLIAGLVQFFGMVVDVLVVVLFIGVKGVGDVLAGRLSRVFWGVVELFVDVKGVGDVLAGVGAVCCGFFRWSPQLPTCPMLCTLGGAQHSW